MYNNIKLISFDEFIKLDESGSAIKNVRPMSQDEVKLVYKKVQEEIFPILGIVGDGVDAITIGSFGKKLNTQTSGDLDVAISADRIASINSCTLSETLEKINSLLISAGYSTDIRHGFNQVSIGVNIPGTNDIGQVDLMISTNLEWSKFMYYSPDFTKAESKYKGLYRNQLLMAIVGQSKFQTTKMNDRGEIEEYKAYVIQLNNGIVEVYKSFIGKRGDIVKTAKKLEGMDRFITNTPDIVTKIAVGDNYSTNDIMTFEKLWNIINKNDFIHKDKLFNILNKFKLELIKGKTPFPTEAVDDYPNIFANI
jgi:hypothetical protein